MDDCVARLLEVDAAGYAWALGAAGDAGRDDQRSRLDALSGERLEEAREEEDAMGALVKKLRSGLAEGLADSLERLGVTPPDAVAAEAAQAKAQAAAESEAAAAAAAAALAADSGLDGVAQRRKAFDASTSSAEHIDSEAAAAAAQRLIEAVDIRRQLGRTPDELDAVVNALNGGFVLPGVGGDLLRDGAGVLPTGRNIHALDPFRVPSPAATARGVIAARKILEQQRALSPTGAWPETVAVTLWGLNEIKTRGESVAVVLELVGARPVSEGTGRVVKYELTPLDELEPPGRPRIDVLASLSGIFRDSFANVVELLDALFEAAAEADDEPTDRNFIRKHTLALQAKGAERPASRLFCNPAGDYGSMVNERVGSGEWEDSSELGDTWRGRNAYSFGRGDERGGAERMDVLDELLSTTERVVQMVDSVEYGLTDIQVHLTSTPPLSLHSFSPPS